MDIHSGVDLNHSFRVLEIDLHPGSLVFKLTPITKEAVCDLQGCKGSLKMGARSVRISVLHFGFPKQLFRIGNQTIR